MTRVEDKTPSLADIEAISRTAFARLPEAFQRVCRDILIQVEDLPDPNICLELGLDSPMHLLGLYCGVDLLRRSVLDVRQDVDRVVLYRLPILKVAREGRDSLQVLVTHVLIHEIGHHFGFSDEDMARIKTEDW